MRRRPELALELPSCTYLHLPRTLLSVYPQGILDWEVVISPPLVLENLLPVATDFKLWEKGHGQLKLRCEGSLDSGGLVQARPPPCSTNLTGVSGPLLLFIIGSVTSGAFDAPGAFRGHEQGGLHHSEARRLPERRRRARAPVL